MRLRLVVMFLEMIVVRGKPGQVIRESHSLGLGIKLLGGLDLDQHCPAEVLRRRCEVIFPVCALFAPGTLQRHQILSAALIHHFPYRPEGGKLYTSSALNSSQIDLPCVVLKTAGGATEPFTSSAAG